MAQENTCQTKVTLESFGIEEYCLPAPPFPQDSHLHLADIPDQLSSGLAPHSEICPTSDHGEGCTTGSVSFLPPTLFLIQFFSSEKPALHGLLPTPK